MSKEAPLLCGALVFAKVRGYPAWPARLTSSINVKTGRYNVFFFGTFETASVLRSHVWLYTPETREQLATRQCMKKKKFKEGLNQLEYAPDIALPLMEARTGPEPEELEDAISISSSTQEDSQNNYGKEVEIKLKETNVIVKKPLRLSDGDESTLEKPKINSQIDSDINGNVQDIEKDIEICGDDDNMEINYTISKDKLISVKDVPKVDGIEPTLKSQLKPRKSLKLLISKTSSSPVATKRKVNKPETERKVWVNVNNEKGDNDESLIDMDMKKPKKWKDSHNKQQWQEATAHNVILLKNLVERGKFVPDEVMTVLGDLACLTPDDKMKVRRKAELLTDRRRQLGWLKTEHKLAELNIAVRSALNSRNPQLVKCQTALSYLMDMKGVKPLMVIKQPDLVDTLRKVKGYRGPVKLENYTKEEKLKIDKEVKEIKEKGGNVLDKFASLFRAFNKPDGSSFSDFFEKTHSSFEEKVESWDEDKVLRLTEEDEVFKGLY